MYSCILRVESAGINLNWARTNLREKEKIIFSIWQRPFKSIIIFRKSHNILERNYFCTRKHIWRWWRWQSRRWQQRDDNDKTTTMTMTIMMVMVRMATKTRRKWQPAAVRERRDETGIDTRIEVAGRRERQWRIEREDDDGDNGDGEKDDQKINSKSTFRSPHQSRKGTTTYSACILGVRLLYWRHGKHVVTELKRAQSI